jgi:formimidoylglutamate deiminase
MFTRASMPHPLETIGAMTSIHAHSALLPQGWARDVRVTLSGRTIGAIDTNATPQPGDEHHQVLLAGLPNLHSHAFQRGMAGLSERRGDSADSFWTWRDVMYRFALTLSPEQMQAIAARAYCEMLEAGFTRVGEFHYLHHDRDGKPYADRAELAACICEAAAETGIALTLLPAFYAHSTFGGAPPRDAQRRFINSIDGYSRLLEGCERHASRLDAAVVGIAPHSLRAVTPEQLQHLCGLRTRMPMHMHIAEQTGEVDDCLAWCGQRPVQWLLDHAAVDARWCLIHATHMSDDEATVLARSGAVVGLCPVTEANLGDGIFNATPFQAAGGRFGIGTDSNIRIDAAGEFTQLEYAQRLAQRVRNLHGRQGGSTGRAMFDDARAGGAQALGVATPAIRVGAAADLMSLDPRPGGFASLDGDQILDAWMFAARNMIDGVWIAGRKRVSSGRHHDRERIAQRYDRVLKEVLA